jgi:hypothetical protein
MEVKWNQSISTLPSLSPTGSPNNVSKIDPTAHANFYGYNTWKRRFHEEDGRRDRRRRSAIHPTHPIVLSFLKHLVLFSVDTIEKDEFVLEKDENQGPANVARLYFLSIEEI